MGLNVINSNVTSMMVFSEYSQLYTLYIGTHGRMSALRYIQHLELTQMRASSPCAFIF